MKKILSLAAVLVASTTLAGCGDGWLSGSRQVTNPEVSKPPAVVALNDVVTACKAATNTGQMTVNGQAVMIKCGEQTPPPPAAKPAAHKPQPAATRPDDGNTVAELRARLHRAEAANRQAGVVVGSDAITVAAVGKFAPAPAYAVADTVYADEGGNTFERHKGGERLCNFYVQGQLRKQVFVNGATPAASKKACDIEAQVFQASLTAVTPEAKVSGVLN